MKYFLAAAETENIHRASEKINVSPPSISKAISRLEDELAITLFEREGRNIRLTSHGRLLQQRASEIIYLEESTRLEVGSHEGRLQVVIAGHEALLAKFGFEMGLHVRTLFPQSNLSFKESFDQETLKKIENGEAHVGFVTCEVPPGLYRKKIGRSTFQTVVGKGHPLYRRAKSGQDIPVEDVLQYSFVSPDSAILGKVAAKQSLDGWRDDQFPRQVDWSTSSLATLLHIVDQGKAIAYLPDYLAEKQGWPVLQVTGCPYSCEQTVYLVAKKLEHLNWLRQTLRQMK